MDLSQNVNVAISGDRCQRLQSSLDHWKALCWFFQGVVTRHPPMLLYRLTHFPTQTPTPGHLSWHFYSLERQQAFTGETWVDSRLCVSPSASPFLSHIPNPG